ncbi:MAG: molybdate transport system permease protein [Gaiellales bacterium]|jgi:molybdate transport system permease protein|nr:molybdate transport system permease protein [Gaiellales bacterium]
MSRARGAAFGIGTFLLTLIALGFLVLPIVAIFARVPLHRLFAQLDDPIVLDALELTATTNAIALAVILVVGTPAAYFLGTRRFRGRTVAITLIELPLVLPPTVAGIGLLAAFAGRIGLLSDILDPIGVSVVFTTTAVVVAICFVAGPFYLRQAIAAFETLDADILDAARVDGAGPLRVLVSVSIPLAKSGLAAGAALAFARGVGEFGATIMFAGNLRGVTQTLPLLIYQDFELSFDVALAISALLVVVSAALLITVKLVVRVPGKARGAALVLTAPGRR